MSAAILRYEPPRHEEAPAVSAAPPARLQRGDGAAAIVFARRRGRTVLADLYQRTPYRVLFPRPQGDEPPVAVLLTTSGGLTGGDRLHLAVTVEEDAAATVMAQAAEKVYRSLGPDVTVGVDLAVGPGGWLEYLPQETILFDGARLVRRLTATLADGARLLACEMTVYGRAARGEAMTRGLVHDSWRIRRGGRLAWADTLRLDGDVGGLLAARSGFAGARALATILYVGDDAPTHLPRARALVDAGESRGGATIVNGVLVARIMGGRADAVRRDVGRVLGGLRHAATGLSESLPRVWHC